MSFDWNDEAVLLLIEKFHDNDILWNPRNPDYKNRNKRTDALNTIATSFQTNTSEIERKLKNLTSHYYREKKKFEESQKSSAGGEDVREPKWFAYKPLHFLQDKNRPAETVNSENAPIIKSQKVVQPKENSRKKRKCDPDSDSEVSEALKVIIDKEKTVPSSIRDDASIFAEYIASKIRKMDPITTSTVQHQIQNIIYQAEMGSYTQRPFSSIDVPGYYTASTSENARSSSNQSDYKFDTTNSDTKDSL